MFTAGFRCTPPMDVACNISVLVIKVMGHDNKVLRSSRDAMIAVFNSCMNTVRTFTVVP